MLPDHRYRLLFRFAAKTLKYYVLSIFGFMLACLLSVLLGMSDIAVKLVELLGGWFWHLGVFIFCLITIAIVVESLQE